jgi:ACS family sodium-dependent inorganic phosphate cotransporter
MTQEVAVEDGTTNTWPRRYTMITLLLIAMLLCYIDRIIVSLAAIEMQNEFGWSDSQKGLVLSVFFAGYLATQILGGFLSNRFGGRTVFLLAVLLWSIFTVVTPIAAYVSFGALIVARVMLGVGEGAAFPSAYNLIHRWMPLTERSRSVGGLSAASSIGTVATLLTAGFIIERFGWPSVFYLFGSMGFVWAILWAWKIPAMPSEDEDEWDAGHGAKRAPIPWRLLITHPAVIMVYVASACMGSISFTLASWLPSYFVDSFEVSLTKAGLYSILPWLAIAVTTMLGGSYADKRIAAGVRRIRVRKTVTVFGMALLVASCLALTIAPNVAVAVAIISCLFGGLGIAVVGYSPTAAELLPEHGDVFYGIAASAGSVGALFAVSATGVLVENTGSYDGLFLTLAGLCAVTAILYLVFGKAEPLTKIGEPKHA